MISISAIQSETARAFNIPVAKMTEPMSFGLGKDGRNARIYARPRQVAMYLSRELVSTPRATEELGRQPVSLPTIARIFRRDHTTVLHAVRQVPKLAEKDKELREKIKEIRSSVTCLYPVDNDAFPLVPTPNGEA